MNNQFKRQKKFSEILDHTFQLCRNYFSSFFMIFLILLGPVILLEAIFLMNSGHSFLRQTGVGSNWFEQILTGYDDVLASQVEADSVIALLTYVLQIVGTAAVLFAVQRIKDNQDFTPGVVIKKAFSRFGPLLGSSIIVGIIAFLISFITILITVFSGVTLFDDSVAGGIIFVIIFAIAIFLVALFLFIRWGFFIATVTFQEGFPGFKQSWQLTRKSTWRIFGLLIVVTLITGIIGAALNGLVEVVLGGSVVSSIITNLVIIVITMISSVAYAVVYFDLKLKQDGTDLKEMIDEYQKN